MSREIWREIVWQIKHDELDGIDSLAEYLDTTYTVSKKGESIEVRQKKFAESLAPFKDKYPREMLKDFYDYWRETTPSGKKMRFELQKTWSIELRLATWSRNNIKNGKPKKNGHSISESTNLAQRILRGELS